VSSFTKSISDDSKTELLNLKYLNLAFGNKITNSITNIIDRTTTTTTIIILIITILMDFLPEEILFPHI
jgi:hypothetical protein